MRPPRAPASRTAAAAAASKRNAPRSHKPARPGDTKRRGRGRTPTPTRAFGTMAGGPARPTLPRRGAKAKRCCRAAQRRGWGGAGRLRPPRAAAGLPPAAGTAAAGPRGRQGASYLLSLPLRAARREEPPAPAAARRMPAPLEGGRRRRRRSRAPRSAPAPVPAFALGRGAAGSSGWEGRGQGRVYPASAAPRWRWRPSAPPPPTALPQQERAAAPAAPRLRSPICSRLTAGPKSHSSATARQMFSPFIHYKKPGGTTRNKPNTGCSPAQQRRKQPPLFPTSLNPVFAIQLSNAKLLPGLDTGLPSCPRRTQ